jgi:hypothetical protein
MPVLALYAYLKDLLPRRSLSAVEIKGFAFWPIIDHIPLELVHGG